MHRSKNIIKIIKNLQNDLKMRITVTVFHSKPVRFIHVAFPPMTDDVTSFTCRPACCAAWSVLSSHYFPCFPQQCRLPVNVRSSWSSPMVSTEDSSARSSSASKRRASNWSPWSTCGCVSPRSALRRSKTPLSWGSLTPKPCQNPFCCYSLHTPWIILPTHLVFTNHLIY